MFKRLTPDLSLSENWPNEPAIRWSQVPEATNAISTASA